MDIDGIQLLEYKRDYSVGILKVERLRLVNLAIVWFSLG